MNPTRPRSRLLLPLLALLLLFQAGIATGIAWADLPTEPLGIKTADGHTLSFTVELANTEAQREYGLMNRRSMDPDHGMLFDFGSDQPVMMWMKDTLIPLDMLFISDDGTIVGIAARAVPELTAIIASPGNVRAVLELNGGTADRLDIHKGDKVTNALFGD